jgi:signal transduction histidine kinase
MVAGEGDSILEVERWGDPVDAPWSPVLERTVSRVDWNGAFRGKGDQLPVQATLAAIEDGFILSVLPSADPRRSERSPHQSQRLAVLGQLSGGIAHDLNNMLAILVGMADLIQATLRDSDPLQESVELILQTLNRASSLSEKMLNFARQTPQIRTSFSLASVLRELQFLTRTALPPGVEAAFDVSPGSWTAEGDENALLSALLNLVINAGEAQPHGGSVRVRGRPVSRESFEVVVEDDGPGMDAETVQRAFETFYSTKLDQKGTGLGLSLARKTVQDHGGSISVDSAPGKGTRITVRVPIAESSEGQRD